MKCFKCDKEIPEGSNFCNHCGFKTEMICPACGKKIPGGSKFCNHCGRPTSRSASRPTSANDGYIDFGLPSGTIWITKYEGGFYDFNEAVSKYGNKLPTYEQLQELIDQCQWKWVGKDYRVTGPNGNAMYLPAAGCRDCNGSVCSVGFVGFYWSSAPNGSDDAWSLSFNSSGVSMVSNSRCYGFTVLLVQD